MSDNNLNKIGLRAFLLGLAITLVLSVGIENGLVSDEGPIFIAIVIAANSGLLISLLIGLYFWVRYFSLVTRQLNPMRLLLYFGLTAIAGYWAHYKVNSQTRPDNI